MLLRAIFVGVVVGLAGVGVAGTSTLATRNVQRGYASVVRDLQPQLQYVQISSGIAPRLDKEHPLANYTLTLNLPPHHSYLFGLKQYVIETGGDLSRIPTASMCEWINHRFDKKSKLLESLRQVQGEVGWSVGPLEGSLGSSADPVIEFLYSIWKMQSVRGSRVLIAIKGYADGQVSSWEEPLRGAPYDYDSISVLPPAIPKSENPTTYLLQDSVIRVQTGMYNNSLLPDLRAEFVKRELVEPFLNACPRYKTDIRIVKGFEFTSPDLPMERKVQVFVYVYKKGKYRSPR